MVLRSPLPTELLLLEFLCGGTERNELSHKLTAKIKVADLDDGGMGSLRLFPQGSELSNAKFGKRTSACQFKDKDGVDVIASLNLDQHGDLFELDIWKTDFGKLIQIPDNQNEFQLEEM